MFLPPLSPAIRKSFGKLAVTFRVLVPMEPVEPRRERTFIGCLPAKIDILALSEWLGDFFGQEIPDRRRASRPEPFAAQLPVP
jgi:hypothetical protein